MASQSDTQSRTHSTSILFNAPNREIHPGAARMANASCRVRAQFPGGGLEKLSDDFFRRDFDHALADRGDDAADVRFAVIIDFCFRAFAMKRDSSLPFHESRSTASFDAHLERFGRIFFRKFDAALE